MTNTQKRYLEIPLLLFIILMTQAFETFLGTSYFHPIPLLISYLAFTRGWKTLAWLSAAFAYIGALTVAYSAGLYVAVQVWLALGLKLIVDNFALEGRRAFVIMAAVSTVAARILTWSLLVGQGDAIPVTMLVVTCITEPITTALLAWVLFPAFNNWDAFFGHEREDTREYGDGLLK